MDKIEEDYTTWLWNTKHIYKVGECYIIKVFKAERKIIPIQEQRRVLEIKKRYFWEYIPETELIEKENWGYVIKQKFVEWKTLANVDISSLSTETLEKLIDLIKKYLKYYKEQWWDMDITWYQYYPWNPNSIMRKFMNFLKINQNFLVSTNIMIWDDGNPYMVDICESADVRFQWKIKNLLAKPFIRRTISNLEETLQKRINFENEDMNQELLNTLDK